jgi:hypothetical protein
MPVLVQEGKLVQLTAEDDDFEPVAAESHVETAEPPAV